jgi:sn-glycerol 3-phosphate transport system ATP-binding protein
MRLADAGEGRLNAQAAFCEVLGAETLVHLRCVDGTQVTVRQDAAKAIPEEGTNVGLTWAGPNEMRFDSNGQRI